MATCLRRLVIVAAFAATVSALKTVKETADSTAENSVEADGSMSVTACCAVSGRPLWFVALGAFSVA